VLALAACTADEPQPSSSPSASASPSPSPSSDALPAPAAFERSSWSTTDAFLGAASFLAVGGTAETRATLATSVGTRLFFAGEHTAEAGPGSVTGARNSGLRAARELVGMAEPGERVLVVGAGMAGATAAFELAAEGFEVIVLEARERSGGRIGSIASADWPFPVERGAAFFDTEADAELLDALDEAGIATVPLVATEVRNPDGTQGSAPVAGAELVASAVSFAEGQAEDRTLLAALGAVMAGSPGGVDAASLGAYLGTVIERRTGGGSRDLSAQHGVAERIDPLEYVGTDAPGRALAVTGGLENYIRVLLDGLDVRLANGVAEVSVRDEAVGVRLTTGESLTAQRIVVTAPLGALKSGGITFRPELPQTHRDALERVDVGRRESVLLRFEEPFWDSTAALWTVTGARRHFASWVNLEPATGEPVLLGVVAAESAEYVSRLGDQQVLDLAIESLLPFRAAEPAPSPSASGSASPEPAAP
jgi:monoamine oxidase